MKRKNKNFITKNEYGCWYCDWKLRLKVYKNKKEKLKEKE